jgi:hypothetical protein
MKTIFKYRERVQGSYVLLYRVGNLPDALDILGQHPDATPENKVVKAALARLGCCLRHFGQDVCKKQHERETIHLA